MRVPFLSFRKNLPERLHLDALEHAGGRVRIALGKGDRFGFALHLHDDKTAAAVGEWSRELHLAGSIERPEIVEMSGPYARPQRSAAGSVMADNHEQHRIVLLKKCAD